MLHGVKVKLGASRSALRPSLDGHHVPFLFAFMFEARIELPVLVGVLKWPRLRADGKFATHYLKYSDRRVFACYHRHQSLNRFHWTKTICLRLGRALLCGSLKVKSALSCSIRINEYFVVVMSTFKHDAVANV